MVCLAALVPGKWEYLRGLFVALSPYTPDSGSEAVTSSSWKFLLVLWHPGTCPAHCMDIIETWICFKVLYSFAFVFQKLNTCGVPFSQKATVTVSLRFCHSNGATEESLWFVPVSQLTCPVVPDDLVTSVNSFCSETDAFEAGVLCLFFSRLIL